MGYNNGEYVMYGTAGICRIDGKERRSFDGVHEVEYCRLIPCGADKSVYFIPSETLESKVRRLLTREEIFSLIDSIPDIEPQWIANVGERRETFGQMLKSDDYSKIFCLLKSLYGQKQKRSREGKKLSAADERVMKTAESLVNQEFSIVLGIKPEEVENFIEARTGGGENHVSFPGVE